VQEASSVIAAEEGNPEFYLSAARLSQIENEDSPPSIAKIFSLSVVYGVDLLEVLAQFGVNLDRVHRYRALLKLDATHPISVEAHSLDTQITIPVRIDPGFRWECTQFLNRVVAMWGDIPAALLQDLNPRRCMYGYIGLTDFTMYPILRPGALIMVDGNRRRIVQGGWANEMDRPIYFLELREGYRCGWCQVDGTRITLIPHPMSPAAAETFRFPDEAEVVGEVVGVAMRIVPADPAHQGNVTALPKRFSSAR